MCSCGTVCVGVCTAALDKAHQLLYYLFLWLLRFQSHHWYFSIYFDDDLSGKPSMINTDGTFCIYGQHRE